MMIKRALVYGLLLMFLVPAPLVAGAGPRISFAVPGHDFGDVVHGESPSIDLTCTNTGDAVLVLERLESSCGCAKAVKDGPRIAPGSSGQIHAQIDTFGMRPGRHSKTIEVYSNDPERPRISLKLNFNVIRHVSIAPPVLAMRLLESEENAVFALTATSHWTKPIVLKAASSDGSGEVALVPQEVVVPPGGNANFQLSVRVTQGTGQSRLKGTALIETDDAVEKILPVRYFIQLRKGSGT